MSTALKARLMTILAREMSSSQFQPSSYVDGQFKKMIGQGVTRMRINKAIDQPGHVIRAENNLKALVKYFSDYARKVGSFPTLSNANFDHALKDCPSLWPYRS
jgi:hypothetical protein